MTATRRRLGWCLVVALLLVAVVRAIADPAPAATAEDRVRTIASAMKCPVCAGQSVAESDVEAAQAIRAEIARRVDDGQGDDEIRDAIAASYGERIQLTPRASGFEGLVWILPVVGLVVALAGIGAAFARWRRTIAAEATDDDRALVEAALRDR